MMEVWIALSLTLFAGLATGIGSVIAFTAKRTNYRFLSVATGFSAGIMVYISLDELLPTSRAYGKGHDSLLGLVSGMLVIALSLLLMRP